MCGLLFARTAGAYCRTTTCDPLKKDCAKNEEGCVREGAPLTWNALPLQYRFAAGSEKLDNSEAKDAIRAAFDTWENVQCANGKRTSLRFQELSATSVEKPLTDTGKASVPYAIFFRDDSWPHDNADESLAITNQIYGEITGTIEYADIEINTAEATFATVDDPTGKSGTDLQLVITHEVGHYIGLAHTDRVDSIMVARYCQSADRCQSNQVVSRDLSEDDITAVCALYPPDGKSIATAAPDPGCNTTDRRVDVSALGLGFVALVVVRRFRRSRIA